MERLLSPAVRNILVKLPKVSAGSAQEAELLKRLDDILILESGSDDSESESDSLKNIIGNISTSTSNKVQQVFEGNQ